MKRIFGVVFAVFMMFCLVGCGDEGGNKKEKEVEEVKECGIGEVAKTENFEISIVKVSKPTEWTNAPKDDEEYVAVEISAKNISKEEASISSSDLQYRDEGGSMRGHYPTYVGFNVNPDTFGAEKIKPGGTFKGTIVYLMPKSLNNVTMWFREGMTADPDAIFKFSK